MKKSIATITLSSIAALSLSAANIPTSGDIQRQTQKPELKQEEKQLPSITSEYKKPLEMDDKATTLVKDFKFSGNSVFTSEKLHKLVEEYMNKELGINKLNAIASVITKYYRDNGYFVARAYLPQQSIKDGVVEIAIIEGTYGNFKIKNDSLVNNETVQGFMDHLKNGQIVSVESLERQMLLINDLSGSVVTNAEVFPGSQVGTSDFGIVTSPTKKYTGFGVLDNYGSRYTGEYRMMVGANINSISGIGDTLGATAMISNTANLKNGSISYDRPLGYSGLKGGISVSMTDYKLDKIPNYEGYGDSKSISAYVSYPIVKTRMRTNNISLSVANKYNDDSSGIPGLVEKSEKSITSATLKLDDKRVTNFFNHQGRLYSAISVTSGDVSLDNSVAVTNDASLKSKGRYEKVNLDLTHMQQITKELKLESKLRAQTSLNKNLDSSEDISVAGSNGVRAYEDSELSGDKGYVLSMDLIYSLPTLNQYNHNVSLFVDTAKVWTNTNTFNSEDNTRKLHAVGLGYQANYKNMQFKTTFAHGFGSESTPTSEAEFSTSKNKLLAQVIMSF
jgi:hemolysin activation/secretion protein